MNENRKYDDLIEELRSLPNPEINQKKQDDIHANLLQFASEYEKKKATSFTIKRIYVVLTSVITLALFLFFIIDFDWDDENKTTKQSELSLTNIIEEPEFEQLEYVVEQALRDLAPNSELSQLKTEEELVIHVVSYMYNYIIYFEAQGLVKGFVQSDLEETKTLAKQIVNENNFELLDAFKLKLEDMYFSQKTATPDLASFIVETETFTSVNTIEVERRENGIAENDLDRVTETANIIELAKYTYEAFKEVPWHEKERLDSVGKEDEYYYYLQSYALQAGFGYIKVSGETIEQYVENLNKLARELEEEYLYGDRTGEKIQQLIDEIRIVSKQLYEYTRN